MAHSNAYCIRQLTPLLELSDILDSKIEVFRKKTESIINLCIAPYYQVPIQKNVANTGTINHSDGLIIGTDTLFTTEVMPLDMIRINSSGECFRVLSVDSDTQLTIDYLVEGVTNSDNVTSYPGKPLVTFSNSTFIVVPDWLVTVTEYESAMLILMPTIADRAREKEDSRRAFLNEYEMIAKPIMDKIKAGKYFDSSLVEQSNANNSGRLVYVSRSNDNAKKIDNNQTILFRNDWK